MAAPVITGFLQSCMHITANGAIGTGFLVRVQCGPSQNGQTPYRIFLVTNKHVIGTTQKIRDNTRRIELGCNILKNGKPDAWTINLEYTDDAYAEHADPDVDVCAIDVGGFGQIPNLIWETIPLEVFAYGQKLRELEIGPGDEILIFGYPLGFRQGSNNNPLVRQGMLSTDPSDDIVDYSVQPNRTRRGFLIDGGVIPGASGGPVILKPSSARETSGGIMIGPSTPWLLGIVAETRFSTIRNMQGGATPSYANLGFVFSARTILETLEKFTSCVVQARAVNAWPL